jgi:hypothetical protein
MSDLDDVLMFDGRLKNKGKEKIWAMSSHYIYGNNNNN